MGWASSWSVARWFMALWCTHEYQQTGRSDSWGYCVAVDATRSRIKDAHNRHSTNGIGSNVAQGSPRVAS